MPRKKNLVAATTIYWMVLVYIVAALIWWFISLKMHTDQVAALKIELLNKELTPGSPSYQDRLERIQEQQQRAQRKYLSEGITFLLLTFTGAFLVYRLVRKQIRLQQQEKNFMMAITHELKTPIAVSKLNLETLQKHKLDEARQQRLINMTLQETNRLNTLTNNILVSSQLEGGRYKSSKEELDFSSLVLSCVDDFKHRFPERTWKTRVEPGVDLNGDPLLLEIMINNLLENSLKYSARETPIEIWLERSGKQARLKVKDEGVGIPEDERRMIFEKFYRIGNEETRKTKGTGIGLYLCKKIATDHNADIHVTNNSQAGSIFIVSFHKLNLS